MICYIHLTLMHTQVNSWQHEMDMSIRMNSKKIFENGNIMEGALKSMEIRILSLKDDMAKMDIKNNQCLKDLTNIKEEMKESKNKMNDEITSLKNEIEELKLNRRTDEKKTQLVNNIDTIKWKASTY